MEQVQNLCRCCRTEIGNAPFCSICGLSRGSITSAEGMQLEEERARDYIRKHFRGAVRLRCYTYRLDGGRLAVAESDHVSVCSLDQYWVGARVELPTPFEPLPSKRAFELEVCVSREGGGEQTYQVSVTPAAEISHERICLEFTPGMKARFVVGTGEQTAASEEFPL